MKRGWGIMLQDDDMIHGLSSNLNFQKFSLSIESIGLSGEHKHMRKHVWYPLIHFRFQSRKVSKEVYYTLLCTFSPDDD